MTHKAIACLLCGHERKPTADLCDACRETLAKREHHPHLVGPEMQKAARDMIADLARCLFAVPPLTTK